MVSEVGREKNDGNVISWGPLSAEEKVSSEEEETKEKEEKDKKKQSKPRSSSKKPGKAKDVTKKMAYPCRKSLRPG